MTDLVGAFVYAEVKPEKLGKEHSGYYNGEYVVLVDTPHSVLVAKLGDPGAHDSGRSQTLYKDVYNLNNPTFEWDALEAYAQSLIDFGSLIDDPDHKLRWVGHVYTSASAMGKRLKKLAYDRRPCNDICEPPESTTRDIFLGELYLRVAQ